MIRHFLAVGALSAIALFGQTNAPQERTRPTPEQMVEHRVARLTTRLSLSATQQSQIKTILLEELKAADALRSTAETAHTNLRSAVTNGAGDAQIDAAAAQVGLVQGQLAAVRAKAQVKLLGVLTAEQRTRLEAASDGREGRGRGGIRGPGEGGMRGGRGDRF